MGDDIKILPTNARTDVSESVSVCEEREPQNDDSSSYSSSTSSSDDSSNESDSESDRRTNKSSGTIKVKDGKNVCVVCEQLFPRLLWGRDYNMEICAASRQKIRPTCLSGIRVFWESLKNDWKHQNVAVVNLITIFLVRFA